jgi:hypothetical protein
MAGIKIEKAADGTISLTGLTPDQAWLICSGLTSMWTELDDAESGQLGDELTKQLEANGYGD